MLLHVECTYKKLSLYFLLVHIPRVLQAFILSLTEWVSLEKLLMHTGTFILTNFDYLNRRDKYAYAFSKQISTEWWIPKLMRYSIYIEYKLFKASLEIYQNTCIIFFLHTELTMHS